MIGPALGPAPEVLEFALLLLELGHQFLERAHDKFHGLLPRATGQLGPGHPLADEEQGSQAEDDQNERQGQEDKKKREHPGGHGLKVHDPGTIPRSGLREEAKGSRQATETDQKESCSFVHLRE